MKPMIEKAVSDGTIPGAVALVARKGKIVHHKAYGLADTQSNRAMKRDDIFRISSPVKGDHGNRCHDLIWEEGHFRLDDPVSKYIPEFKNVRVLNGYDEATGVWTGEPAKREITIRHLLTHPPGLGMARSTPIRDSKRSMRRPAWSTSSRLKR
jgi:CubicO group peptidase (beta-lactamase class C family)